MYATDPRTNQGCFKLTKTGISMVYFFLVIKTKMKMKIVLVCYY